MKKKNEKLYNKRCDEGKLAYFWAKKAEVNVTESSYHVDVVVRGGKYGHFAVCERYNPENERSVI